MKLKTLLIIAVLLVFAFEGYSQKKQDIKNRQDSPVQIINSKKPDSKTIKSSAKNAKVKEAQPSKTAEGKKEKKGFDPQPDPPGKVKKNKVNTLSPQPLSPVDGSLKKKGFDPQPDPPVKPRKKVKSNQ